MPGQSAVPAAGAVVCASVAEVRGWARHDWGETAPWAAVDEALADAADAADVGEVVPDLDSDPGELADGWEEQAVEWARVAAGDGDLPEGLRGCFPAGLCPRDDGQGAGFAAGGVADRLAPGVVLAGLTGDRWEAGLGRVSDDELIGVLRAWHRLGSWSAAGELAAVGELSRRRLAEVAAGADPHLAEHVGDELAVSLTLTGRAADSLLDFGCGLARLPLTAGALACGVIDRSRAWVIVDELGCLDPADARLVEARVVGRSGQRTTGQLRIDARRAALAVDPAAAKRRTEQARKQARVEIWDEGTSGTSALAGRDLPPADVLAADKRIDTLARHLRASGAEGTLDQLRARVYVALLLGKPIESVSAPASTAPAPPAPAEPAARGGCAAAADAESTGWTGMPPGSVNLTMPLSAWLGTSSEPGEVAGFGPIPADDARILARLAGAPAGAQWCVTFTDGAGRAVAHGCASARRPRPGKAPGTGGTSGRSRPKGRPAGAGPPGDWELAVTIRPIAVGSCLHLRESAGYRPSAWLHHVTGIRQRTCGFPGCRRRASQCDSDHTIPYDQGGRTCECNLAPLCRRHHRAKQAQGWHLDQPEPGILVWRLPHGRTYRTRPDPYPGDKATAPAWAGT